VGEGGRGEGVILRVGARPPGGEDGLVLKGGLVLVDEKSKPDEDEGHENFAKAAALVAALDDDALAQKRIELSHCRSTWFVRDQLCKHEVLAELRI
jgi:hypothetical protein